ncbi:MAG: trimeric intracellular cation channel family protein [Micropepsaceae bacterium]
MTLLFALYMAGLTAAAMSGALAAGRRSMDWVGVLMLASVTALGGGSMRDVLLGHYPLSWVAQPWLLGVTTGAALVTLLVARYLHRLKYTFLTLDAVGLVVTTMIGCDVAMEMGQPVSIVVLSGMITGCVGGVLRDVLCNQIPLLFSSELYASVSVLVGVVYVGGLALGIGSEVVTLSAVTAGLTLRLLAVRYGWGMPKFVYTKDWF